ncbi:MAG: aminoacyl-tRNA hydrolase [Chloroflexi bacterium]|nr:aminoacyl-tRNA hydrolase [Chloroflexota bacterium]
MKLIVGLGNPGPGYANSLHNLGFMCLNHFARRHSIHFDKKQGKARTGTGEVAGNKVLVARPETYMNQSGQAVSQLVKKFNIGLDDLLVICDDMDLPLGKIRIRPDGGSGGHKGVQSIITELGSQNFPRLRVGVGHPISTEGLPEDTNADVVTFLLSELPLEVKKAINQVLPRVSEAILCAITEGITVAMNKYN